jgi:trk system potassium uptake protein TrkA
LHAKEIGAKRVLVKGVTDEHGKILKHLGVERVIFPEVEMAIQLADTMTWPNVLDALTIDTEYSLAEVTVPESLMGVTLRDADLRRRFGLTVLGIKDHLTGKLTLNPDAGFRLTDDQLLLMIGRKDELSRFSEMK